MRTEQHSPSPSEASFVQLSISPSQQGGRRAAKRGSAVCTSCAQGPGWGAKPKVALLWCAWDTANGLAGGRVAYAAEGTPGFYPCSATGVCSHLSPNHLPYPTSAQEVTQASSSLLLLSHFISTSQWTQTCIPIPTPTQPFCTCLCNSLTLSDLSPVKAAQLSLITLRRNALRFSSMVFQSSLVSHFYKTSGEVHATGLRRILTNQLHVQGWASANMLLLGKKKSHLRCTDSSTVFKMELNHN